MTTDADTTEHIDLDVDLDSNVPCQAADAPCDRPAAWRWILTHKDPEESVCTTRLLCDPCTAEVRRALFTAAWARWTHRCMHLQEVLTTRYPLHPGRR